MDLVINKHAMLIKLVIIFKIFTEIHFSTLLPPNMQYGSGVYDMPRNYHTSPVPRMRPEAYEIAGKHVGKGMFSCLNQPKPSYTFSSVCCYTAIEKTKVKLKYFLILK